MPIDFSQIQGSSTNAVKPYTGVYNTIAGSQYYPQKTAEKPTGRTDGRTDGRTWRADANAWMTDGEYAAWRTAQPGPGGGGGGGSAYTPTPYTPPPIDLPIPDYGWNPTQEQRDKWQTIAEANMALKYDPQRNDIINALATFKNDASQAQTVAGRNNVAQQLGFANMIKNQGEQPIIDSAIRRGAQTSGWLTDALSNLGQYETSQRGEMTQNYNNTIDDLVRQVLNADTTSGKQMTDLSGLQGNDLVSTLYQLENTDRGRNMEVLSKTFENKYNKAALVNNIAAEIKRAEQQDALITAQMAQQEFENNMSTQQFAADQANAAYARNYTSTEKKPLGYVTNPTTGERVPYYSSADLQNIYQAFGLGGYAPIPKESIWD
jgi:hypothetical protein